MRIRIPFIATFLLLLASYAGAACTVTGFSLPANGATVASPVSFSVNETGCTWPGPTGFMRVEETSPGTAHFDGLAGSSTTIIPLLPGTYTFFPTLWTDPVTQVGGSGASITITVTTCPTALLNLTPTSCWQITEGTGTTITDSTGSNTGTLGGTGFAWQSNGNLLCTNSGGSGCSITTPNTYTNPQPATFFFGFAGTQGPIWQLGSSSSNTATTQFYLGYLDRLGRLTFGVNNYGNMTVLQTSLSYADGNQHNGVMSIGPSSPIFPGGMRLYIDGQLVSTRNVQLANYANGAQFFIGGANATIWPDGPSSPFFNGTIYYLGWLNGTQVTDAQAEALSGLPAIPPMVGVPLTTLTATIGSLSDFTGFAPPPGTSVYFSISGVQRPNTGDFIIAPTPSNKACQINAAGNLIGPTGLYANCQLPQGAHVTMTIGSAGQPLSLIIPFQSSVDLATLILAQTDPASLITGLACTGPLCVGASVTNPPTGQAGTATLAFPNCGLATVSTGTSTLDTSTATCQGVTLEASSIITLANLIPSQLDTVYVVEHTPGGFTPAFAAPAGETLAWINGGGSTQPDMPTTATGSVTTYKFILNGTMIIGRADYFDSFPNGTLNINGVTYNWPGSQGAAGTQLKNDGSGNLTWAGANNSGSSLYFGGSSFINTSVGVGNDAIFHATRALTVDNCYAAWPALGACGTFPVIRIRDATASATICSATGDNTGNTPSGASQSVTTSAISSGDTIIVDLPTAPVTCSSNAGNISIGIAYH